MGFAGEETVYDSVESALSCVTWMRRQFPWMLVNIQRFIPIGLMNGTDSDDVGRMVSAWAAVIEEIANDALTTNANRVEALERLADSIMGIVAEHRKQGDPLPEASEGQKK